MIKNSQKLYVAEMHWGILVSQLWEFNFFKLSNLNFYIFEFFEIIATGITFKLDFYFFDLSSLPIFVLWAVNWISPHSHLHQLNLINFRYPKLDEPPIQNDSQSASQTCWALWWLVSDCFTKGQLFRFKNLH